MPLGSVPTPPGHGVDRKYPTEHPLHGVHDIVLAAPAPLQAVPLKTYPTGQEVVQLAQVRPLALVPFPAQGTAMNVEAGQALQARHEQVLLT